MVIYEGPSALCVTYIERRSRHNRRRWLRTLMGDINHEYRKVIGRLAQNDKHRRRESANYQREIFGTGRHRPEAWQGR